MKHRPITLIVLLSAVVVSAQSPRASSVCFSTDADGDEIITITGDAPLRFDFSKTVSPRTFVLDLIGATADLDKPTLYLDRGGVVRVSATQYSTSPQHIVRVVTQTTGDYPYLITRRGNALYLDIITEEADPFAGLSYGYTSSIDLENVETYVTAEASTTLLLQNGETGVIGGLLRRKTELVEHGVPLLSSIPVLGLLFKSTSDSAELRELLIFVTPHLVRPE